MGKKARKKAAAAMARKKAASRSTSTASAGGTARRPSRKKKNRKAASPGNSAVAAALAGAMVALNMSNVAYGQKVVDLHSLERKDVKEIVFPEEGKDVQTEEEKVTGTGLGNVLEKKEKTRTTTSTAMLEESPPQVPDMSGKRDDDGSLSPALVKMSKDKDTTVEDNKVMAAFSPYAATHIKRHDDGTVSYRLRGRLLSKASKVPKGQCTNRSLFCQPNVGTANDACQNTNITSGNKVFGCGSCDGEEACDNLFDYSFEVGEDSCQGAFACGSAKNSVIGDFSCVGDYACDYALNSMIDDYACQGDYACNEARYSIIGKKACLGEYACNDAESSMIEDESCVGEYACLFSDYAKISKASCIGNYSCSRARRLTVKGESCVGAFACSQGKNLAAVYYVEIGDKSCNCRGCCKNLEYGCKIPKGKCNSMDYDCSFNSSRGCPMF